MYLFDYEAFLVLLEESDDDTKRDIYDKWLEISFAERLEDEPFYEYLESFDPIVYKVPSSCADDFDWDLLLRLVAGSFSSDFELELGEARYDNPELVIIVPTDDGSQSYKVSEQSIEAINNLFEIYALEQINIAIMQAEGEMSESLIDEMKESKLNKYNDKIDNYLGIF